MKTAAQIVASLAERDLLVDCERIAKEHHVPLEQVCDSSNRQTETSEARHAIWRFLIDQFGGAVMPAARLWGCNHTSLVYAEARLEIVSVLLATYADPEGRPKYQLEYARRAGGRFGVNDLDAAHTMWFPTYELAHRVFARLCEEAGEPTFRSHAAAASSSTGGAS